MVCTVTPSTVAEATGAAASLGVAATIGLIVFLVSKEISAAAEKPGFTLFRQHLNISVLPLLLVFLSIVITKLYQALEE